MFTRGETQALVTCTLGTADDAQKIESFEGETWKSFMLHYNFPPFSVGEVAFLRGPGRREVGHGALAEQSLAPMLPVRSGFPYTVRVVSDILESNGSSSMASVCGGSLAMMDAGVPIKAPVAGIAMGLVMDEKTGKYAVLSDIAGAEDHYGDMDFKVAGILERRWRARARSDPDGATSTAAYVRELNEAYNHFFFHYTATPLLVVETSQLDLEWGDEALDDLIKQLAGMGRGTRYYVPRTK